MRRTGWWHLFVNSIRAPTRLHRIRGGRAGANWRGTRLRGEYELEAPPHERAPEGGPVASTVHFDVGLVDLSTQRVRGFAAGDAITVDGTVTAGANGASAGAANGARALQAQRLFSGNVAAYRESRADVGTLRLTGTIFTALGLALLALGGVLLRRALRTPPATPGAPS